MSEQKRQRIVESAKAMIVESMEERGQAKTDYIERESKRLDDCSESERLTAIVELSKDIELAQHYFGKRFLENADYRELLTQAAFVEMSVKAFV